LFEIFNVLRISLALYTRLERFFYLVYGSVNSRISTVGARASFLTWYMGISHTCLIGALIQGECVTSTI